MGPRRIFDNATVIIDQDSRARFEKLWGFIFPDGFLELAMSVTAAQLKVFAALTTHLTRWNFVRMTRDEVAKLISKRPEHVSTALTQLADAGFIYKHSDSVWEISPSILWYGSVAEYQGKSNAKMRGEPHHPVAVLEKGRTLVVLHYRVPPPSD